MQTALESVTDAGTLNKLASELEKDEDGLTNEIVIALSKKNELQGKIAKLNSFIPNFEILLSNSKNSSDIISFASKLALGLSSKVKQLDLAKTNVLKCVLKLDSVITLRNCASGVETALANGKYEEASEYIYQYASIKENVTGLASRLSSGDDYENPIAVLNRCQKKLIDCTTEQFDDAVKNNDRTKIENFFRLFKLLGESDEGLDRFGRYLYYLISINCEDRIKTHERTVEENTSYVGLLTEILEFIAETLKTNQFIVQKYYSYGNLFPIVKHVQNVCDRYTEEVIESFRCQHRLPDLLQLAKKSSFVGSSTNQFPETMLPKSTESIGIESVFALEPVIADIVALHTHSELYLGFVHRRVLEDFRQADLPELELNQKLAAASHFFDNCQLVRKLQDLIGNYISLEGYYLFEMILKATSSDEVDDSNRVFRFVDDVFFILGKSIRRSFSSANVDGICAMLNLSGSILSDRLLNDTLATHIRHGFPSGWMQDAYNYMQSSVVAASSLGSTANMVTHSLSAFISASAPSGSSSHTRYQFLIALNSIETSLEYLNKLTRKLVSEITSLCNLKTSDLEKLQACLNEFKSSTSRQLEKLLDTAFEHLTTSFVRGQAKSLLNLFGSSKYDLTENDLDVLSVNDPWMESCIENIENFIKPFQAVLSNSNCDRLILILVTELLRRLEQHIQRKTFTRYGAIQLEKELRGLFSYLTSISFASLRDHFTRILQICNLLNLDNVDEVSYYWNLSLWRLTPNEVRRILSLRTEFRTDDIRRLKL